MSTTRKWFFLEIIPGRFSAKHPTQYLKWKRRPSNQNACLYNGSPLCLPYGKMTRVVEHNVLLVLLASAICAEESAWAQT